MARPIIDAVIDALRSDSFAREHRDRRPLHLPCEPGQAHDFSSLLSLDQLDAILSRGALTPEQVSLSRGGALPPEDFTKPGTLLEVERVVDVQRVVELHSRGATIVVNAIEEHAELPFLLCQAAELALGLRASANAFLTPPGERGFPRHWDTSDSFVIQLRGRKRWRLWASGHPLPLAHHSYFDQGEDRRERGQPLELELGPGDRLYVPRGWVHEAQNPGPETSLHLALALHPHRWIDLMRRALARAEADPRFREALPPPAEREPERLAARFTELGQRMLATIDPAAEVDALSRELLASAPRFARGQLASVVGLAALGPSTWLRPRVDLRYRLSTRDEQLILDVPDHGTLELPERVTRALRFCLETPRFRVADIPDLDADGQHTIALRMVVEGLLLLDEAVEPGT
ncbi:hypothetical protein G6O69_12430 [Pseudenhygromyxa sp. WMMC2535]|uniref:JmjC domain-containing protein n=1 Tax=Pseudenhygromyxa sp. WMMC2535 TaxID=2712867 RepID=UPI00155760B9|nr:cupin domain-containing protein [Pseudenhygromyxa sp. WMMC2535]NVB38639.1 hypothetical protein [Pseudenhygromyxa sp. WMMC2535]